MVVIPEHARKQAEKRGIEINEIIEAVEKGEISFEEIDPRFGRKKYSILKLPFADLVAVWFSNKKGIPELITVYWRRKRI
jgi:hypothetical protein